jgi:hypothetical protein
LFVPCLFAHRERAAVLASARRGAECQYGI